MDAISQAVRAKTSDAAQWLYQHRDACGITWLRRADADTIRNVYAKASAYDAKQDKKYSLSDLEAAYAIGHYDGCNAPNAHINERERDDALKEI